jgi:DNA-binding LacI/PurR family transcriptional regulator
VAFAGARRPAVLSLPLDRGLERAMLRGAVPEAVPYPVTRHRWEGFADAWAGLGGAVDDLRVAVTARNSAAEGEALAEALLAEGPPPDAIAAMSDELALGALRAIERAGVEVAVALSLTGWDDSDAAAPAGLTTLAQSLRDQGVRCARLALGKDDATDDDERAPWRVVERRSTR